MMDKDISTQIQLGLAKAILECAKDKEDHIAPSFSRIFNEAIEVAIEKGIDKKILKDAVESGK